MDRRTNDRLRQNLPSVAPPNGLEVTREVRAWGEEGVTEVLRKIREYGEFTEDTDPRGLHDFGVVDYRGIRVIWEIVERSIDSPDYSLILRVWRYD